MPAKAPLHQLGKNGPLVPSLGFGLMGLSYECYGATASEEERFKVLDRAYELGATFWDSSDLYGDSDKLIGKWFKRTGKRDEIFIATKFGFVRGSKTLEINSTGEYCKKSCAETLEELGVDSIDLYYMHHANHDTPIEETMRALAELQAEGKIKHIGLSAISSATLRRAVKIAPVAAVQTDYSPFVLDIENSAGTDLLATCRELGIAVVGAMPLGRGMITANYATGETESDPKDRRAQSLPRFMGENRAKNAELITRFKALAEKKGCTAPQLSLAWLLKQGDDIFPIPGTKRIKYLEENWASLDVKLTDEDVADVRHFLENSQVAGHYLPPQYKDMMFSNTAEE